MQLPSPQSYLIKTKTNLGYYFYLTKDRTIAFKIFTEENVFLEEEVLTATSILDFAVSIDGSDYIHLVCITGEGLMNYYILQNDQWNHRQIAKLDIKSNVYRNLVLILKNKITHVLCNKTNFTNPAISSIEHMYWNDKSIKKITVTTYLPGKYASPFQVDVDSIGNLHLVYKVLHTKNSQLYYSFFNIFNTKWSNGEIISSLHEDHSHPHVLIDRSDNLHLVWCTIEDNNFTLKHKRKVNINHFKSKWSGVKNLSNPNSNNLSPILLQEGAIIKVFSKQNNRINEVFSEDFGQSWQASKEILTDMLSPNLIKFSSNASQERLTNAINKVYGEITDTISVIGASIFKGIAKKDPPKIEEQPQVVEEVIEEVIEEVVDTIKEEEIEIVKTEPINNKVSEEKIQEISLDKNLKVLVQEVQEYINRMALEVEKIEEAKKFIETDPLHAEEDPAKSSSFQQFQNTLQHLNEDLNSIENEQFILQKELDDFQKKIYSMEDKMIQFKKQLLELEDKVMKIPTLQSSFVSKLKNIFR
ncbi:hypothetical protein [Alkaliphilus transvaalensis]|uniref:hypothetical protein n=1 Tax=Alkaliphilus transvaalensis TaxID=114628 RepID=UPI0004797FB4|nr:hypothetical protein [Alkaliphilus transvaalensis]